MSGRKPENGVMCKVDYYRIRKFRARCRAEGDHDMVAVCNRALQGGQESRDIALTVYRQRFPNGLYQTRPLRDGL